MAQQGLRNYDKQGPWQFSTFSGAPDVMIAEAKFKKYDDDWLCDLEKELRVMRYKVFINRTEEGNYSKRRKTVRIEIYKKFNEGTIREHVSEMKKDFQKIFQ